MPSSLPVLVVDDSPVARLKVVRRLRAEGLVTLEADSVKAARAVAASALAAAILDYELPDGTGHLVGEELRATAPALPIAFFTSASRTASPLVEGLGPCFHKPDELDALIEWTVDRVRASTR